METEDSAPLPSIETLKALQKEHKAVKEMTTEERLNEIKEQLAVQMQGKKRVVSKSPVNSVNDLRWQLQQNLNKLNTLATRDAGVKEIKRLIEDNVSMETLSLLVSNLREQKKTRTSKAREQEVMLIAHVASVYRLKLVEEGPTPLKTLAKVAALIHLYFKDLSREVHEAAGLALSELYVHCYPKTTPEAAIAFLYDPLVTMLSTGADVQMQHAAAYSVYKWTFTLAKTHEVEVLNLLFPKVVGLFLKLRPEYPDLISALGILMDSCGFEKLIPEIVNTLAKLVLYIQSKQSNSQILKLEACKFVTVLPAYLKPFTNLDFEALCQDILPALLQCKGDKQPEVQIAANRAYSEWKQLVTIQENIRKSQEKPESVAEDSTHPTEFRPLTAARAVSKVKKEWEVSPDLNFKAKWGVSKPQILEKGSGKYGQMKLGTGKVDVMKALASRQSIRELVVNRLKSPRQNPSLAQVLPGLVIPRAGEQVEKREERGELEAKELPRPVKRRDLPEVVKEEGEESMRPPSFGGEMDAFPSIERIPEATNLKLPSPSIPPPSKSPTLHLTSFDIHIQPNHPPPPVSKITQTSLSRFQTAGTQYEAETEEIEEIDEEELGEMAEMMEREVEGMVDNMVLHFEEIERWVEDLGRRVDIGSERINTIRKFKELKRRKKTMKKQPVKVKMDSMTQTLCEVSVQTSQERPLPVVAKPVVKSGCEKEAQTTQRTEVDPVSQMWLKALKALNKGETGESFRMVLESGDDLYLLRLILKTGVCLDELPPETCEDLLERLGLVSTSDFLGSVCSDWLRQ